MTHVVLGYPSLSESIDIVLTMAKSGASIIELQIPFSDPIADGSTIMFANEQALANKITPTDCFKAARIITSKTDVPILFMTYFNIVYRFKGGVEGFCKSAASCGVQGLIVPDVSLKNNADNYWNIAHENGLSPIPIVSPITNDKRLSEIAKIAKHGFAYCVSTTSTTGAKQKLPTELPAYLKRVRKQIKSPIAVGFGISKKEHVKSLSGLADIAVVGSATIDLVRNNIGKRYLNKVSRFCRELSGVA